MRFNIIMCHVVLKTIMMFFGPLLCKTIYVKRLEKHINYSYQLV